MLVAFLCLALGLLLLSNLALVGQLQQAKTELDKWKAIAEAFHRGAHLRTPPAEAALRADETVRHWGEH